MEVADVRQAFARWNQAQLQRMLEDYSTEQQAALQLIPLIFHINHRLLPGYNGPDTPAGIYGYKPEKDVIELGRQFNRRFNYQQERVLKNAIIDAVYLQQDFIHKQLTLWLIHFPGLKPEQFHELNDKLQRVAAWLRNRDIHCHTHLLSAEQLASLEVDKLAQDVRVPALFIDQFYLQARCLAGKYPAWWLVPAHEEAKYARALQRIVDAMFVNPDEFIDLGAISVEEPRQLLEQASVETHHLYEAPEICWLKLVVLSTRFNHWPSVDSPASRLKLAIVDQSSAAELTPESVCLALVEDLLEAPEDTIAAAEMQTLLMQLQQLPEDSISPLVARLAQMHLQHAPLQHRKKTELAGMMNGLQALFQHIGELFSRMLFRYRQIDDSEEHLPTLTAAEAMLGYLKPTQERVAVYNTRLLPEMVIGRMILRFDPEHAPQQAWQLVLALDEVRERILGRFSNLLSLLAWALLNRLVDQGTQISIDHPSRMVKQIEARQVLETLLQRLDVEALLHPREKLFEQDNRPQQALVFSHLTASEEYQQRMASDTAFDPLLFGSEDELTVSCEQLVLHSWGDVQVRQYTGNLGVLQCLCDWLSTGDADAGRQPGDLHSYGYSAGISTFWSQRIEQIYADLQQFFYSDGHWSGRFVVRMGPEYFLIESQDTTLGVGRVGTEQQMLARLERASDQFKTTGIERFAFSDMPLGSIYKRNRAGVVQIFFQLLNRQCRTWVLDEQGSLWYQQQLWFDRSSYIAHWLYVMRNLRTRLKKISYQQRELPGLEIFHLSNNALGVLECHPVGSESITAERGFIDVQLTVDVVDDQDRVSLICDGHLFDYGRYGDRVLDEAVRYIRGRFGRQGLQPVYVTDIEAPLRLYGVENREQIQVNHFLRYKRNIEQRLYQLLM